MKTPLISVVTAAYNAGKYIEECLNSMINQSFQDWECIIVDDASTDNTLSIIKKFADKDSRFRYDTLPANSGSAKIPRDKAVSYAKAEWILQIDADDFIESNVMERLYARAMETGADIVFLRVKEFDNENHDKFNLVPDMNFDMQRRLTGDEAIMLTIPDWKIAGLGLTRKKLWDMRSTVNSGTHHMNVDEFDGREWFFNANFIVFEDVIYHYRQHSSSITKNMSFKQFETLITDKMVENLIHERFGKSSQQALIVSKWRMENIFSLHRCLGSKLSSDERKRAKKLIKENFLTINKNILPRTGIKRFIFRSYILYDWYSTYSHSGKMKFLRRLKQIIFGSKKLITT